MYNGRLRITSFCVVLPAQATQFAQSVLGEAVTIILPTGVSTPTSVIGTISDTFSNLISKKPPTTVTTTTDDNSPFSPENIIDATNEERVKAGLQPLKTNDKLAESSKLKVEDMINNDYFEHHFAHQEKQWGIWVHEVGYDYVVMGENLALGDFSNVMTCSLPWMNSPGTQGKYFESQLRGYGCVCRAGNVPRTNGLVCSAAFWHPA